MVWTQRELHKKRNHTKCDQFGEIPHRLEQENSVLVITDQKYTLSLELHRFEEIVKVVENVGKYSTCTNLRLLYSS